MKKNTKKLNINDLAVIINKSFNHVEERFNKVDDRFDKVEERLNKLEIGQEEIKLKFNFTVHRFELKELEY